MKITKFLILILSLSFFSGMQATPTFEEISSRGDRNLRIISLIYQKYPFMPAKKEYFQHIEDSWVKRKVAYEHAIAEDKKNSYLQFMETYKTTNEVLRDICIDMANFTDMVLDDFSQKLVEVETKRIDVKKEKFYNRFLVSRNEFSRAEEGFKRSLFYYSARLYDHGIDLMISIYKEQGWNFPKTVNSVSNPEIVTENFKN